MLFGNPWIFDNIIQYLSTGKESIVPSKEEKMSTMIHQLELAIENKGEKNAVLEMRKHFSWYLKNMPEAAKIRERVNRIDNKEELEQTVKEYLNSI